MLGRGLVWLGGGQWSAAHTAPARAERSAYAVSGGVVALVALLTWVVVTLALVAATTWPAVVAAVVGALLGALVAAVLRALTTGPAARTGGWGRIAAACVLGLLVGEIATTVLLSGAVDRRLTEEAASASTPAVVAAESQLTQAQAARTGLDTAVDDALAHRDAALVVARCEYNPTPECPTTSITGVPGAGPETTNSNELLADAQVRAAGRLRRPSCGHPGCRRRGRRGDRRPVRGAGRCGGERRHRAGVALGRDELVHALESVGGCVARADRRRVRVPHVAAVAAAALAGRNGTGSPDRRGHRARPGAKRGGAAADRARACPA